MSETGLSKVAPEGGAMTDDLDIQAAHHRFAVDCFNRTWDLLDQEERSEEETAEMIHLAHASRWHWGHSEEGGPKQLAVGAWQLARVYAVAGRAEEASRYAADSLAISQRHDLAPFYVAYAYEALARAAAMADRREERDHNLALARATAASIADDEHRQGVLDDLATI